MLTVLITSIPASNSAWMSCQRLMFGPDPGTVECAISSTSATAGRRSRTAARSISSKVGAAV